MWYLGIDCATKTFAFSLSWVDLAGVAALRRRALAAQELLARAARAVEEGDAAASRLVEVATEAITALDAEVGGRIVLADGETVDLFPGRPDKSITTVERLKAVARYVESRLRPALVARGGPRRVVIEYQSINPKSTPVAAALVALFADEDVYIVSPALKNKVATCEEGRYSHFAELYSNSYGANKAHAKFNFAHIESVFGSAIPATTPALRGHIADSFMQIIGFVLYGDVNKDGFDEK